MPEVGTAGQRRLKAAKVLTIGAGGLGSPLGLYLAAAGVGTLGMVDFDVVDESNLHRQVLFGRSSVGRPKIQAATERLRDLNPHIKVVPHEVRLDSSNALELFRDYDIVVDGTDNFPTRYLVNDACVLLGKPNVYGSIFRFEGQVSVVWGAKGPCYRCLFPEPPPPARGGEADPAARAPGPPGRARSGGHDRYLLPPRPALRPGGELPAPDGLLAGDQPRWRHRLLEPDGRSVRAAVLSSASKNS